LRKRTSPDRVHQIGSAQTRLRRSIRDDIGEKLVGKSRDAEHEKRAG